MDLRNLMNDAEEGGSKRDTARPPSTPYGHPHQLYTSISPTPPSQPSRTPSSMRQSPLATFSHLPSQPQPHHQHSQPNTPLGPPQYLPHQRTISTERSFSNASNGIVPASPAQRHPGIPNLLQGTPSRERSISVSPKTTVLSLKRPASSSAADEPPPKQVKTAKRKYTERPIWARLSKHNPRCAQQGQVNGDANGGRHDPRPPPREQPRPPQKEQSRVANADADLMRIKSVLGEWERSYKNLQPLSDTTKQVAGWMFKELAELRDVGTDPHYGAVEIEGKIGTLFDKDTGERCNLDVMNTVILKGRLSDQFRFESRMIETEHAHMNQELNQALRDSLDQHGRVKMRYQHFTDIDSFQPLSPAGLHALPPSIRDRVEHGRSPKLRTTVRHQKSHRPRITARIVKVNVSNLHIFSPNDNYDLRISINVEVNLDRPDLVPEDLVDTTAAAAAAAAARNPDRRKDRVSYQHLAYQIDLTRVDVVEQPAKYELEIEVDANLLREQMGRWERGEEQAFGDVVAGFLDNATWLMRERPKVKQ